MLALSACASASHAATLLSTIGNPVTLQTNIFRSNVNPTFDFQTDAAGGTVTSIVFQMNATSNAAFGYPDSIATTVQIQILQGASVVGTFVHSSYDAGTKRVTLTGSAALAGNTTYTIRLGCTTCANTGFDQTTTNATGWQFTSNYFGTGYPIISLSGTAADSTSPTVQIQNAPPSLSNLNAFNVTFQFSETVTGFVVGDISVGNGSVSNFVAVDSDTYTADITPSGSGNVTIDVAAGVAQDAASNPNTAATQVTVTCGVGCGASATIQATQRAIQRFASQRIRNMTAEGPGISGLLDGDNLGGGFNRIGGGPVGFNYAGKDGNYSGSFSSSLQQFARFMGSRNNADSGRQGSASPVRPAANVWIKGRWTRAQDDRGGIDEESDFGIVYLGADYRFSDRLLIGVLGQVDWADQTSTGLGVEAEGRGWMVGPYVVQRLSPKAVMDLRLAWGKSDNKINPVGTYWDDYDSERWQVEGNLTGSFEAGNWHIAPALGLNYFKETQEAYTDSNGFLIGEQTVELGTLSFGPTFTYRMQGNDGLQLRPFVGVHGIWDFKAPDAFDVSGIATGTEELRAKLRLGLNLTNSRGMTFLVAYSYDGIGLSDYEAHTGELTVNVPLTAQGLPRGASLRGSYALQAASAFESGDLQQARLELNVPF